MPLRPRLIRVSVFASFGTVASLVLFARSASADPAPPPATPTPPAMPRPVVPARAAPATVIVTRPPPPVPAVLPLVEPYWTQRRFVGLAITGAGAVGVVIGSIFGAERAAETSNAAAALENARTASPGVPSASVCTSPTTKGVAACTALSNALSANVGDAQVEESLLVGGGVILGLGLITTFWPGGPESPLARLAPMTGPRVAGLEWSASF